MQILDRLGDAVGFKIIGRRIKAHVHTHQALADQVGLAWLFHADRDIGLAHRQVKHALFQHQVDLEVGEFLIELGQTRREPKRAEPGRGSDAQFAEHLILAVADAGGGGIKPLEHGARGIKQQFALLGENQPTGMAVKQGGIQRFFQRSNLAADRRLRQVKLIPRMRQAADLGDRMKDSKLVPIHYTNFLKITALATQ